MIRYYVTDRRQGDVLACASRAIRNGVDMIQVREKDLAARDLFDLVYKIRDIAAGSKTRILVNDRLDIALAAGIDGVVCSPREIQLVRKVVNPQFKIVTPGIRLPDQSHNDQQRVATPREALSSGADYIVLGRAVTGERDPRTALQRLLDTL